jgi:uncharacterized coiled-coil protein SlyX
MTCVAYLASWCSRCGAAIGERCRTPTGYPLRQSHSVRLGKKEAGRPTSTKYIAKLQERIRSQLNKIDEQRDALAEQSKSITALRSRIRVLERRNKAMQEMLGGP